LNQSFTLEHRMTLLLAEQVIWITGASQGIGQEIAETLAAAGAHLALFARNADKLNTLAKTLQERHPGCECLVLPGDVRESTHLQGAVQSILQRWGRLDVLVNNAGVAPGIGLLQEFSAEEVARVLDTNLKGAIFAMQTALGPMVAQQSGCIINVNSVAGKTAFPYWSIYAASKFGLRAITEALAQEQRQNGIKVCGIYPGAVDTPIWDGVSSTLESASRREGMLDARTIADAVLYILSQANKVWLSDITLEPLKPAL
jgi:3-hydroxy acid dehydrogenase/malonic semialdehyde reductase